MSSDDARRATERLQHVLDLARGVNSSRGLSDLLEACFLGLAKALPYDEGYLALEEGASFRAFFVSRKGDEFIHSDTVFDRGDAPLTRHVLETMKPLLLDDATAPETVAQYRPRVYETDPAQPRPMRGMMAVPVRADPVAGVLSVQSEDAAVYDEADLEHLTTLAELICVALKRVRWDEHEAILQNLGRIGHSAADASRFFQSLLEQALATFEGSCGEVWELSGASPQRHAASGSLVPDEHAQRLLDALAPDGSTRELHDLDALDGPLRTLLAAAGVGNLLSVPIGAPDFRGLLLVAAGRRFTQWDVERADFLRRELVPHLENLVLYRKLAEEAIRDPLTGAFNRRYFMLKAEEALAQAERYGHGVAFLVVDLERFSEVNDTHGHKTGDRVLARVAQAFQGSLRASDAFFRIGGDEFVLLLPQADLDAARGAAERCTAALASEPELSRYDVRANIGWAIYPNDGTRLDDLLETGDRRMYVAKSAGAPLYDPSQE